MSSMVHTSEDAMNDRGISRRTKAATDYRDCEPEDCASCLIEGPRSYFCGAPARLREVVRGGEHAGRALFVLAQLATSPEPGAELVLPLTLGQASRWLSLLDEWCDGSVDSHSDGQRFGGSGDPVRDVKMPKSR